MDLDFSGRLVVLDTEQTSEFRESTACVCEIAAVEIIDGVRGRLFHKFVNPQTPMPWLATKIHGLTEQYLRQFRSFEHIGPEFQEFIGPSPLLAHNAASDRRAINHDLVLYGLPPLENPWICTQELALHVFGQHLGLDNLLLQCGLRPRSGKHGAKKDTLLLTDALMVMRDIPKDQWIGKPVSKRKQRAAQPGNGGFQIEVAEGQITFRLPGDIVLRTPVPPYPPDTHKVVRTRKNVLIVPRHGRFPDNPLGASVVAIKQGEIAFYGRNADRDGNPGEPPAVQ